MEAVYAEQGKDNVIKLYSADRSIVKEVRPAFFSYRDTLDMLTEWEHYSPAHLEHRFINPSLSFEIRHALRVDVAHEQLCNDINRVRYIDLGGFARLNAILFPPRADDEAEDDEADDAEEAFVEMRESVNYDETALAFAGALNGY